ncbi:MAG: tRNA pseudouridine(55) synthase TruB [Anaerolineales bacterium]|nr:tRNA pseudouridine(55) synthase TruB [Anaerolineales bacterium]
MKSFGIMIVDKPVGPTSHQIVAMVRRGTGIRKVGHAGTLDPRASGVLVLCLGAATRLSEYLSTSTKRYEAVIRFGISTETYDSEGPVIQDTGKAPTLKQIESVLDEFRGEIMQVPPPYSAIKIKGKKAYELARQGKEVELEARSVTIHVLKIQRYERPDLAIEIECTAGTYIRSLAHDIGERLGSGAHLASLRRTKAGPFVIEDAEPLPKLEVGFVTNKWEKYLRPATDALPDLLEVVVGEEELAMLYNGHRIPRTVETEEIAKALGPDGDLVAILEPIQDSGEWHPAKVFIR